MTFPTKKINWVMVWMIGFVGIMHAQTPTTNLTTHEPTITTNFEWHSALPIGSGNVVGTSNAVAPGVYYGVYNYGTCYSEPSPIRVATNTCPATTLDFRTLVDSTDKPSGTFVTFHSASPVSDANKINATAIAAAGTYFTAYYDATSLCYTEESVIVMVVTTCAVPTLSLAATSAAIAEGNSGTTAFTFTVTRAANTTGATTVDYAVTGSGTNPANAADFGGTLPTGTVSFAAGETSKVITVNVSGDVTIETDETFTVTLSNPSSPATITTATATGTIQNDDSAVPTLSLAATSATKAEGNAATTAFTFTVTRASNTTGATTVDYAITGSGTNPANAADFGGTLPTGTVSFAAGETSKVITVNVSGDVTIETDETFTVTLSNPSGSATIATATAIGTIQNDDSAVAVTTPATISGLTSATITGNAPSATGGTSPYTYSDGSSDPACIAPSGYTSLTGAGGTVNGLNASTGAHTITAPSAAGSYYYCIKVCDASGTNCAVSIHKVTVTASIVPVAVTTPTPVTGEVGTTITGNAPSATGGTSPYTYSDGSSDPACIAPSGYTSLSAAGGTVNGLNASTGAHTITAPNAIGNYYYCIKVCDTSGTNCAVSIHKVTVTAVTCKAGYASPKIVKN